jgi:hypothetical protein
VVYGPIYNIPVQPIVEPGGVKDRAFLKIQRGPALPGKDQFSHYVTPMLLTRGMPVGALALDDDALPPKDEVGCLSAELPAGPAANETRLKIEGDIFVH